MSLRSLCIALRSIRPFVAQVLLVSMARWPKHRLFEIVGRLKNGGRFAATSTGMIVPVQRIIKMTKVLY